MPSKLRPYVESVVTHSLLIQTSQPSTVEKIIDVASVDSKLDLYVAANAERWHLDASRNYMLLHFSDKFRA
jgi:hypothetical protein